MISPLPTNILVRSFRNGMKKQKADLVLFLSSLIIAVGQSNARCQLIESRTGRAHRVEPRRWGRMSPPINSIIVRARASPHSQEVA
jgi:hypothetical protein|uniref:Uncharacterized protein n=1 Tax=Picea glauca TaxID=3330 RepID=A0A117NIZ2_PICGL|nr:hypothetical protein ABT39_MTgene489 [Picea glauca]